MPNITLLFGFFLSLVGLGSFFLTHGTSKTALIPALVGVLLIVCGLFAQKASFRKMAMHLAVAFSFLGFLGSFYPLRHVPYQWVHGIFQLGSSQISALFMAILCIAYVSLGFASFITARRNRTANNS